MSEHEPEKTPEKIVEPATDPEPEKEPEKVVAEVKPEAATMPEWAKEMRSQLNSLAETVQSLAAKPEESLDKVPGDGDVIHDESPASRKPWHKRGFWS